MGLNFLQRLSGQLAVLGVQVRPDRGQFILWQPSNNCKQLDGGGAEDLPDRQEALRFRAGNLALFDPPNGSNVDAGPTPNVATTEAQKISTWVSQNFASTMVDGVTLYDLTATPTPQ